MAQSKPTEEFSDTAAFAARSYADVDNEEPATDDADAPSSDAAAGSRGRFASIIGLGQRAPLLPQAGAAGAPLTAVIAVISSLAALALSAFVSISAASSEWTADLAAAMTVQVKGVDIAEIEARTATAVEVLLSTPGVIAVEVSDSAEAAKLLEPWLGGGADAYLNVPAIIEVEADPSLRDRVDAIRADLAAATEGVTLDDHGAWNQSLASAARSGQALAFGIFLLIMVAACAVAIFAARAGLAANAEIVSILHLIGATDQFIANEVQRRFFTIGLRGSLVGVAIAIAGLSVAFYWARSGGATEYFLPSVAGDLRFIAPIVVVPLAICLATAMTARLTVLNSLKKQF